MRLALVLAVAAAGLAGCRSAVCADLQSAADHLRQVVERCGTDETRGLGVFDRKRCEDLVARCGPEERALLQSLAACDRAIVTCASEKDGARALTDVRACAERTSQLGRDCRGVIGL